MEKATYKHDTGKNYEILKKPASFRRVGYAALDIMGIPIAVENEDGDVVVPDDIGEDNNG